MGGSIGLRMTKARPALAALLQKLEAFYGRQTPSWPSDPYLFLVWWHSGYPASDERCTKGWEALNREIGAGPHELLKASPAKLAHALKSGGMVPELRAMRLKEIAARVKDEFDGDLRAALVGPMIEVRRKLKQFPNIGDPGADRILLFAGIAPVAAVASNCPHVVVRIEHGEERENYAATYREAQQLIEVEVPVTFDARMRAYLLLKQHGQQLCKRTKPKCPQCPIKPWCAYFAGSRRGRASK